MIRIERHGTVLAVAAFALVALAGILCRPLLPVDETRYLTVAWEMRLGGHWLVPHLNGGIYTDKPPLLFWLVDLVWAVFGVSETAARLVGPAFGVAAIAATAGLARRLWPDDAGAGGRAALVLCGMPIFTLYAGLTMFDAMLTLAVVLGMWALAAGDSPRAWIGLGAALALGALAKGPVILVHLLPAAVLTPLWAGDTWRRALVRLARALALGVGLVAVWLVPAMLAGGAAYREAVLWTQSAGRVAHSFAHGRGWWWFLMLLPLVLWPWIWSGGLWRRVAGLGWRHDRGLRLCAVWGLATLVLFSLISGKQVHYLLPAMPAAALLAARAMRGAPVGAPAAGLLPLGLGLACLALWLGLGPADVRAQVAPDRALAAVGVLLIGVAVAALSLRGPALAAVGPALVLCLDLGFLIGEPGRLYDAGRVAQEIAPRDDAGIGFLGDYEGQFTFVARLRHPVTEFATPEQAGAWLAATPGAVLIARLDRPHPEGEPSARIGYDGHVLGIWGGTPPD